MTLNWHGTQDEWNDLCQIVHLNCLCLYNDAGDCYSMCDVHKLLELEENQRILDGLVFARRQLHERMLTEEFTCTPVFANMDGA